MAALGIKAAAAELGVSGPTVRRLIKAGVLGHSRIGRRVTIPASEIERFQAERFRPAAPQPEALRREGVMVTANLYPGLPRNTRRQDGDHGTR